MSKRSMWPCLLLLAGLCNPLSGVRGDDPPYSVPLGHGEPLLIRSSGDDYGCDLDPFARHQRSVQILVGAYTSPVHIGPPIPAFDFAPVSVRFGRMLYSPCGPSVLRGNMEILLDMTAAPVLDGYGSVVVGPSLLLRGNFVQPEARFVPYIQGGAGVIYNDAYRNDPRQRFIGQAIEFYLQAGLGFHYLVSHNWSVDAEGGFVHISNADMNGPRNLGVNALGGSIGVTYRFPRCRD